jgi:hypothetical protein
VPRQRQALLHHVNRDEEGGGDLLLGLGLIRSARNARNWSRGCSGALDVLGERVVLGDAAFTHDAGHRRGLGETLLLHEQLQHLVASATDRDLEHAGLDAVLVDN